MLSEEFIEAVNRAFISKGFDLRVEFRDIALWDEAIFLTRGLIAKRGANYVSYHSTFKVEFLLENGNLISLSYRPGMGGQINGLLY